jgi:hypothetical protein
MYLPLLAGLLLFVFASGFFQVSDCDVGYHLRTAAYILSGHPVPTTNTFASSTPEHPWLLHQWVGTIIFYLPFTLGGVTTLIIFKALVAVAIMFLVWLRARDLTQLGSWWPSFWAVTMGTLAARVRFFERPDLLSAFYFALVFYLDGKWNTNRRWQWIGLPVLMAVWANTHAGVIYGFTLLAVGIGTEGVYFLLERLRGISSGEEPPAPGKPGMKDLLIRLGGFMLSLVSACLTVQLINPNGWRVLWFPVSQFTSKFWQSIILEYQPPTWAGEKAFYICLAAVIVAQALTLSRINWRLLLVTAVFGYLACRSQRSLLFFVIAVVPHAAWLLDALRSTLEKRFSPSFETSSSSSPFLSRGLRLWGQKAPQVSLLFTWIALTMLVFVPDRTFRFGTGWYHPYYPLELYHLVNTEIPPQGIFNEMRYGGSMLWWLYPRFKPFIDGRGDAYSEELWLHDYFPALNAKAGWKDILKRYGLHCVLLPLPEAGEPVPLEQALLSDPDWALVGFTDYAVLFLERTESNRSIIAKNEFKVLRPGAWSFDWIENPEKQDQGAKETTRALALSPDGRFARTAQAKLLMTSERFPEAISALHSILQDYPDVGELYWRDYGYVLCRSARFEDADRVFSRMIAKNQLPGYAYFMKYHIALERHDAEAADRCLSRALELEPRNTEYCVARTNLDEALRMQR